MKKLSEWDIIEIIRDHKPEYSAINERELAKEIHRAIYGDENDCSQSEIADNCPNDEL